MSTGEDREWTGRCWNEHSNAGFSARRWGCRSRRVRRSVPPSECRSQKRAATGCWTRCAAWTAPSGTRPQPESGCNYVNPRLSRRSNWLSCRRVAPRSDSDSRRHSNCRRTADECYNCRSAEHKAERASRALAESLARHAGELRRTKDSAHRSVVAGGEGAWSAVTYA